MKPLEIASARLSSEPDMVRDLIRLCQVELPDDERFQTIKKGTATLSERTRCRVVAFVETALDRVVIGTIALGKRGYMPPSVKQGRWVSPSGDKLAGWNYHSADVEAPDFWAVDCVVSQDFLGCGVHLALLGKFNQVARSHCSGKDIYFHTDDPEVQAFCLAQGWKVAFIPVDQSKGTSWVMVRRF